MIKNVVFDFGGVITDLSRDNAVRYFQYVGLTNAEEYLDKYHQKGIFLEIEDGRITPEEFCRKLGDLCHRHFTFDEARQAWLAFFTDVPQYKLDYVMELRKKYKVYILSNTNPFVMSWARSRDFTSAGKPLDDYCDKLYTSYEIKAVKPDRRFFDYMIADAPLVPSESLFVDDGAANIEAGKALGFHTYQPRNKEDWRSKLDEVLSLDL